MGHAKHEREWIIVDRLADIILTNVEGCIVDIGMGLSTIVLSRHAKKFERNQYSCEADKKYIDWFCTGGALHDKHKIFHGRSWNMLKDIDEPIALAFMDGSHAYERVKNDCETVLKLMPSGGIIFIHDTYPPGRKYVSDRGRKCGDVYRVRQEYEKSEQVWAFTWPYATQAQNCGLTMLMKREEDAPFYKR